MSDIFREKHIRIWYLFQEKHMWIWNLLQKHCVFVYALCRITTKHLLGHMCMPCAYNAALEASISDLGREESPKNSLILEAPAKSLSGYLFC